MKPNLVRRPAPIRRAAAVCALLVLGGCAASSGPAPILLRLPPAQDAAPVATAGNAGARWLALRRVGLPEYLLARRVRYRADAATLAEWPNTYWAERIEIGVTREFATDLRARLPGWNICESDCAEHAPVLTLQLDLQPLDYNRAARELSARARLTLTSADARVSRSSETPYVLPAGDDSAQAQAAALARLLSKVADDAVAPVNAAAADATAQK